MYYKIQIIFASILLLLLSSVWCWSELSSKIILSHDLINFHFTSGLVDPVSADTSISVSVQPDQTVQPGQLEWTLTYQANPLVSLNGKIMPDRIYVKTSYTNGFESLYLPRFVGRGTLEAEKAVEVSTMEFRYMPTGMEKPGTYDGDIFSLEGGPTIHVKMIIEPPEEKVISYEGTESGESDDKGQDQRIEMSLLPDTIHFPVTGPPGEYDADSSVLLTVTSKYGFIVTAKANPLHGQDSDIPASRLFVTPDTENYYDLENDVVVLERSFQVNPEKERTTSNNLGFRLRTLWDDGGGEYTGEIIFTCTSDR